MSQTIRIFCQRQHGWYSAQTSCKWLPILHHSPWEQRWLHLSHRTLRVSPWVGGGLLRWISWRWSVDRGPSVCALCVVCECVCFWASPPFVTIPQLHDWTVPWLHPRWDQWWEQLFCTCSLKHFSHFFSFLFYPFDSSFYPHTLFENHYQDWKGISPFNDHWLWFSEYLFPLVDVNAYCNVLYCRYFGQNSVFFFFSSSL